jgi:hypothetical protein
MTLFRSSSLPAALGLLVVLGFAPGASLMAATAEKAVAPEKNPPGDIPDTQVFIDYRSPLGFVLKVPEGWSRGETVDGVAFADKYNTIVVHVVPSKQAPAASAGDAQVTDMLADTRAVKITSVKPVKTQGAGEAIVVAYSANSDPNAVTNKQIRLEGNAYLYFKDGKLATLELTAPLGADNVDQWQLMANSFRWQ